MSVGYVQLDFGTRIQRPFEIGLFAGFQRCNGALQELHVQVVADLLNLPALFLAQEFACAANFQIVSGQGKSGAQLFERLQRLEPLDGIGGHCPSRRGNQIGIRAMMRATDPASQLMNLRQPESIGAVDDDGIGRRHVDPAFDDGCADQNVEAAVIEIEHELFEVALAHLAVSHRDGCFRDQFAYRLRRFLDGLDGVVHEVNLTAAANLTQCRLPYDGFVPFE